MKDGFRQRMAWLHTWAGLVAGWLLFAMFVTGTLAVFRPEINQWMRPDQAVTRVSEGEAIDAADRYLRQHAADAARWFIRLPNPRDGVLEMYWATRDGEWHDALLDPGTLRPSVQRATLGGEFFYRFHFELQMPYPWGRWLASFAAMVMLVVLVSGIVTHRRFFKDFFTFRPRKAAQRAWLDAHNALGVLALPFHLVITLSGVITLMALTMPAALDARYGADSDAFYRERGGEPPVLPRSGVDRPLPSLRPLAEAARRHWPDSAIGTIVVGAPGDANARVTVLQADNAQLRIRGAAVVFDGATGRLLDVMNAPRAAALTHDVLYGLHTARFAGGGLRWLYFLCGVLGSLMIASGLVLWAIKRRQRETKASRPTFGTRLVEVLNVAAVAGLPLAIAAFFWSNRLLPVGLADRAQVEVWCFFGAWALSGVHAACARPRTVWLVQLRLGAAAFALLPLLSALTTRQNLFQAIMRGQGVEAGFELAALAFAAMLAWSAHKLRPARAPTAIATRIEPAPRTLREEAP
ncbi:PepSY-associated TM helix domain-containing protein [Chitiniphilus eburneus]|uniref:PepSY domain-containing protein n=1 Tax=Chitiniphilus eburneus TaxID=2571148 RepID=A0A4U0PP16_9NEIS|nr:PepSY-associated TM helix domain-containing protein [Chitiniphilus eburneus]TJZ64734.1 PepSY domain-containing protein [Chitiniphilus eburneus]